jgi:hypothetical protein
MLALFIARAPPPNRMASDESIIWFCEVEQFKYHAPQFSGFAGMKWKRIGPFAHHMLFIAALA